MKYLNSAILKLTAASVLVVALTACGGAEDRKEKYLEKGKVFLNDKNYEKARIEFKNVLQIDPKYAEAYYLMGQLEEKRMELLKAVSLYRKAIELDPSHIPAKIELAEIYTIAGTENTIKDAKKLISEVYELEPNNLRAKLVSATLEYKTGSKEKAVISLEKLIAKDSSLVDGGLLLANIYISNEKFDEAKTLLMKLAKDNPQDIQSRMRLAQLSSNKFKDLDLAEKYIKEVIEIDPDKYIYRLTLSRFYGRSDQINKAEQVLRDAIREDETEAQRYLMVVELLSSRVSIVKAEEELKNMISARPDMYELKFAQAKFYEKIGRLAESKEILSAIIEDKKYDNEGARARILMANYSLTEGDQIGAKKYIDEVIAEHPNNQEALILLSKLALINLDAIDAINNLRTVVKNSPKMTEASMMLAKAYELNGESDLAESELKKAIESDPINDIAHANYAEFLLSKGRRDDAVAVIDKALTYFKNSYSLSILKLKLAVSRGDDSEILSLLDAMEDSKPSEAEVNTIRGKYFISKKNVIGAIEQFEKAYKKTEEKYSILNLITSTYLSNNDPKGAHARLQKRLDEKPNDVIANQLIGHVYLAENKISEAREKFLEVAKTKPSWLMPYSSLASTYVMEKKYSKAIDVYLDAINKVDNVEQANMQLAALYEVQKEYAKAMSVYKTVLDSHSSNKVAANNYASLLLDFGDDADAKTALALVSGFSIIKQAALRDTLAWANVKTGNTAKAIEILKPIVDKIPNVAVYRYHLGYALYVQGNATAAKSHLEIAVASDQDFVGKDKAKELLKSM